MTTTKQIPPIPSSYLDRPVRKTSSQQEARLNACRPMNKAGMTSASYPFPSPSHTSETATGPKVRKCKGSDKGVSTGTAAGPKGGLERYARNITHAKWRCKQAMWLSHSLSCGAVLWHRYC
ncbi:hypothetical protein VTO58DRAFT_106567 [Aureobasidium pullulans]